MIIAQLAVHQRILPLIFYEFKNIFLRPNCILAKKFAVGTSYSLLKVSLFVKALNTNPMPKNSTSSSLLQGQSTLSFLFCSLEKASSNILSTLHQNKEKLYFNFTANNI